MSTSATLGAIITAIIGIIVYAYQRRQDRKHAIMSERRKLYSEYLEYIAPLMFLQIETSSQEHFDRLLMINKIGGMLEVLAPVSVFEKHNLLMEHLREKGAEKSGKSIENFFDDQAMKLLKGVTTEMRNDALPMNLF